MSSIAVMNLSSLLDMPYYQEAVTAFAQPSGATST